MDECENWEKSIDRLNRICATRSDGRVRIWKNTVLIIRIKYILHVSNNGKPLSIQNQFFLDRVGSEAEYDREVDLQLFGFDRGCRWPSRWLETHVWLPGRTHSFLLHEARAAFNGFHEAQKAWLLLRLAPKIEENAQEGRFSANEIAWRGDLHR